MSPPEPAPGGQLLAMCGPNCKIYSQAQAQAIQAQTLAHLSSCLGAYSVPNSSNSGSVPFLDQLPHAQHQQQRRSKKTVPAAGHPPSSTPADALLDGCLSSAFLLDPNCCPLAPVHAMELAQHVFPRMPFFLSRATLFIFQSVLPYSFSLKTSCSVLSILLFEFVTWRSTGSFLFVPPHQFWTRKPSYS